MKKIIPLILLLLIISGFFLFKQPTPPIEENNDSELVTAFKNDTIPANCFKRAASKEKCYVCAFSETAEEEYISINDYEIYLIYQDKAYTDKDNVAAYIYYFKKLPTNYITKHQAKELGWKKKGNNDLSKVAPGKSIGGDPFQNNEKILPENSYQECDIDYQSGSRNAKRIVFSKDAIYYTEDHYASFELMYE